VARRTVVFTDAFSLEFMLRQAGNVKTLKKQMIDVKDVDQMVEPVE
jgi:hypothetical protein